MAKYIITGGAGFIGSNITKELVRLDHNVKVIDNLSTGKKRNLAEVTGKIKFVKGDIRNLKLLEKEFKGYNYVLHQAALVSVPRSIVNPVRSNRSNIDGTLNVLVAARNQKIKRVIYASSSSVYGDVKTEFKTENETGQLLSFYALTKFAGEIYCHLFYKLYGLETVCLRYFNVFGPNQDQKSQYAAVIPKFINIMLSGKRPVIYGDGNQSRDFTYVKNNVLANILTIKQSKAAGEVFNIACQESYTLNQLVQLINKELKTNIKPIYAKSRPGDIRHSKANISKAKRMIGYQPITSFKEGLIETIKWYQKTKI